MYDIRLIAWLFAFAVCFVGSLAKAEEALGDPESERYSELEKEKSSFRDSWVLPGADFSQYSKIYIWDAVFEYRDVGSPSRYPSSISRSSRTLFAVPEEARAEFEQLVGDAFRKALKKGKNFELVDSLGPDTLILRGGLLDIISKVPPETVGRTNVYLSNIGEATMVIEVLDGDSGTVLAMLSERRRIDSPGGGQIDSFSTPANRVTISSDIRRWAANAATRLRKELDEAMN
ncbi:MAG TPA: DUF3313 family protein [Pseudomonadales bacterium]